MKQFTVATLAGLLVLSVVGHALGQAPGQAPASQGDELRLRPNSDQPPTDTTVIDDSTPSAMPNNNDNQNQIQPLQPQNNDGQERERPNHRRRPRPPFHPFSFLMPGFGTDPFDSDPSNFSPFRQSPLMDLIHGGSLFNFPDPRELRSRIDEQIKDMDGKPDVWSKEVRRYSINGVQYEKITFTRKVEGQQQQQQQPAQIDMEQNGEQQSPAQQVDEQRQRSPVFSRLSNGRNFQRSLSNVI